MKRKVVYPTLDFMESKGWTDVEFWMKQDEVSPLIERVDSLTELDLRIYLKKYLKVTGKFPQGCEQEIKELILDNLGYEFYKKRKEKSLPIAVIIYIIFVLGLVIWFEYYLAKYGRVY